MIWIAVDCDMGEHPKIAALSCDDARWAWMLALMKAKKQRKPGRFASLDHLEYVLGDERSRYVEEFVKLRLVDVAKSGTVTVHGWSDYQRSKTDNTAAERQRRFRDKQRNGVTNGEGNADRNAVTPVMDNAPRAGAGAVAVGVSSSSEGGAGGNLLRLVEELTNRPFGFTPGSRPWVTLQEDVASMGTEAVAAAYRETVAEAGRPLDAAGVIYGGHKRLFPIPDGPRKPNEAEKKADADEAARIAYDKRVEKTQREIATLRGDA